jgi:signal peptidase I
MTTEQKFETPVEPAVTPKKEVKKESTGEMIRSFLIAILIALVFRSVAYEPFHIPSGSMLSTLYKGDYIFVSKLSYGYSRYSFPLGFDFFDGRVLETAPERGDVVVFRLPANPRIDFIKRVIGLPGDKIQVLNGRLFINGTPVEVTRRGDIEVPNELGNPVRMKLYEETLPNGKTHIILDETEQGMVDNTPVYVVPEGHYFMMGDNRDNSEDSRFQDAVGFIPAENLIGRAEIVLLSYDTSHPFWKFWEWPEAFRGDRFVKKIR